jgi:glyoxylase-like metal-dependent hydrolase (beta-lactamase superfamily II)
MASAEVEKEVDRLIDERPGRELLHLRYDEAAVQVHERVWRSTGTTASYLVDCGRERVIVNCGMGFEAPHHKHLFAQVRPAPTRYIVTTQGHVDHVGGVAQFREPGTLYVAHTNNPRCQADDKRIAKFRAGTARTWFPELPAQIADLMKRYPNTKPVQDVPTPDSTFETRMRLRAGDLDFELIHCPGGETIDSLVVWIPAHRVVLVSNLFGPLFPHFPNFNTLRGDLYRFPVPYLENVDRVRALGAEVLITGRHLPIVGAELIDACLARMRGAVEHVHEQALAMINEHKSPYEIMRSVSLPPELRVGQGYGKIEWAARTIFEAYTGWFQRRSTADLYAAEPAEATAALASLLEPDEVVALARDRLAAGDAATAIRIAEAVLARRGHRGAMELMLAAHEALLETGDESFWESGWLRHQIARWRAALG